MTSYDLWSFLRFRLRLVRIPAFIAAWHNSRIFGSTLKHTMKLSLFAFIRPREKLTDGSTCGYGWIVKAE